MTTIRQQSPKLGKRKKPFEKAVTYEKKEGLLTKSTHDYTVRMAPPLVITAEEVK